MSRLMQTEELENAISYNNHAVFMARVAVKLLEGDYSVLNAYGVRELIALYLLVPYITNSQLDTPNEINYNIPQLDLNSIFTKVINKDGSIAEMTLDRLRNAICHSFVSTAGERGLLLDDRASYDRKTHDNLADKDFCNRIEIEPTRKKLLALHKEVILQQVAFNSNLMKTAEVVNE